MLYSYLHPLGKTQLAFEACDDREEAAAAAACFAAEAPAQAQTKKILGLYFGDNKG